MNNIITSPKLPPRKDSVEVIDENGNHVYQLTQKAEEKLQLQSDLKNVKLQLQQSDDTAIELYEAQELQKQINIEQDDSIITLYENLN